MKLGRDVDEAELKVNDEIAKFAMKAAYNKKLPLEAPMISRNCGSDIEKGISTHFDGMHLNTDFIANLYALYGEERMNYVLANTVQMSESDGRFSPDNKAWAKGISINNSDEDRRKFYVTSHPALLDGVRLSSINRPFIQTAAARFGELSLFMPSVLTAIKDAADKANEVGIFLSGQTKPLFMQNVNFLAARNVIELLSRKGDLAGVLTSLPIGTSVSIGTENSRIELAYSSVISSSYSVKDTPSGTLAVIAPIRTDYGRVISIIECISECVSKIISELIEH